MTTYNHLILDEYILGYKYPYLINRITFLFNLTLPFNNKTTFIGGLFGITLCSCGQKAIHTHANFWQNVSDSLITYCILEYPFFVESQMIPIDMQRLIKKTSNPVRKKIELTPTPTEPTEMPESQNIPEPVIGLNPAVYIEDYVSESEYISEHYRPLRSVGNSGWQLSDVWRELRVDDFCE